MAVYFTNPTSFYVRSETDQISVLFRRGPYFVNAVLRKIRKFIRNAGKYKRKGRYLTQSYDKSPYTSRNVKGAK